MLALIPLIALLWQSQSDLAKVGQMTTLETRYVVDVVGDMQRLDGAVVDLERSIRQYAVIPVSYTHLTLPTSDLV